MGGKDEHSQVAAISFDAFGGAETLPVVGVAHACVAVTLAGWRERERTREA